MSQNHTHQIGTQNIKTAFFLNLLFTGVEIVGGLWVNSVAILADAVHDLGDSFSLGIAWYLENYSEKAEDKLFSYGYKRFSLLGALLTTLILIAGSLFVLSETIPRLFNPEHSNAQGMLWFAIGGILVNGAAALKVRQDHSMNARIVAWHFFEDILGWAAVLIVSVILLFTDIHILDPILSVLITLYILVNVFRKLQGTVNLFLQVVPDDIDIEKIEREINLLDNTLSCHHTHIWSLDGEHHVLTTHVVVEDNTSKESLVQIKYDIAELLDIHTFSHSTIELEFENEECRMKHSEVHA